MKRFKLKSIKGKKTFSERFNSGKSFSVGSAKAIINFDAASNIDDYSAPGELSDNVKYDLIIDYAVIISKRNAKKAVVRNRIKRLLRESLRQSLTEMGESAAFFRTIILIRYQAPVSPALIKLRDIKPEIDKIIDKAANFYKSNIYKSINEDKVK